MFELLFVIGGVGLTNLVVNANILNIPRNYISSKNELISELLSCMMCAGFWCGIIFSFYFGINILLGACVISIMSHIFDILKDFIIVLTEKNIVIAGDENEHE